MSGKKTIQVARREQPRETVDRSFAPMLLGAWESLAIGFILLALVVGGAGCSRVMSSGNQDLFGRKNSDQVSQREMTPPIRQDNQPSRNDMMRSVSPDQAIHNQFANSGSVPLPLRSERKLAPMEAIEFPGETRVTQATHVDSQTSPSNRSIALAFSDTPPPSETRIADPSMGTAATSNPSVQFGDQSSQSLPPERPVTLEARILAPTKEPSLDQPAQLAQLAQLEKQDRREYLLFDPVAENQASSTEQRQSGNSKNETKANQNATADGSQICAEQVCANEDQECHEATVAKSRSSIHGFDLSDYLEWQRMQFCLTTNRLAPGVILPCLPGAKWMVRSCSESWETGPIAQPKISQPKKTVNPVEQVGNPNPGNPGANHLASAGIRVDQSAFENFQLPPAELDLKKQPIKATDPNLPPTGQAGEGRDFIVQLNAKPQSLPPSSITPSSQNLFRQLQQVQENGNDFPIQSSPPRNTPSSQPAKETFIPTFLPDQDEVNFPAVKTADGEDGQPAKFTVVGWWMVPALPTPTVPRVSAPKLSDVPASTAIAVAAVPQQVSSRGEESPLRITNPQFCSEIRGFGQITPLLQNQFAPTQRVLVYCEVENYRSQEEQTAQYGTIFVTRFVGSYQLINQLGQVVQSGQLPEIQDRSQRRRRDFYLYFPVTFGALPNGEYQLTIQLNELTDEADTRKAFYQGLPVRIMR